MMKLSVITEQLSHVHIQGMPHAEISKILRVSEER